MSGPSSNTSPTASAFYDPDSSSWRTSQGSLLSEEYPLLERLPDWGTTAAGALCVQATPEHLTNVRDGSASPNLPTPTSVDSHSAGRSQGALLAGDTIDLNLREAVKMLPTPTARDWKDTGDLTQSVPDDDSLLPRAIAHHVTMGLTGTLSNDGNGSSDDEHPTQPIAEDCDPSSSSG